MKQKNPLSEYLILSRGQWDKDASREDIQEAIERFLVCEVRPIDPARGSAYALTNETPTG